MITIVEQVLIKLGISYKSQKRGQELQFHCIAPDHNDRRASCSINTTTGQWLCWSCLKKGNLKTLVKLAKGDIDIDTLLTPKDSVRLKLNSIYKKSTEQILSYENSVEFQYNIDHLQQYFIPATNNRDALKYLVKKRKLSKETIKKFNLMYATNGVYDERIIIPYYLHGEMIGFNSRYIGNNPNTLRYLYYINSDKFEKFLYSLENIINKNYCILTEGPFDLMYLLQCGYKNVISTLNTAINPWQMAKILEFSKIIFCFDNDSGSQAGQNAVLKHAENILAYEPDMPVYKVDLPADKDPNDCDKETLKMCFSNLKKIKIKETSNDHS